MTCSRSAVQSWNLILEGGLVGSKSQKNGQRDGTRQQTDLQVYFFFLIQPGQLRNEIWSAHSFHMKPTPSLEDTIYLCFQEKQQKWKEIHTRLKLTAVKTCIYMCTFANIFSCMVNLRPVWAGRICAFTVNLKIWWVMEIKKDSSQLVQCHIFKALKDFVSISREDQVKEYSKGFLIIKSFKAFQSFLIVESVLNIL